MVKIEDFWKLNKIFQILAKNDEFHIKKLKEVSMLGFEHPSHMVTHPSTDEAQCCLTLEIFKKWLGKKRKPGFRRRRGLAVLISVE